MMIVEERNGTNAKKVMVKRLKYLYSVNLSLKLISVRVFVNKYWLQHKTASHTSQD